MEGYIAQVLMFAGNFAPKNWAFCNGQLLSIASNTALFSILGTMYGGDGRTTFALPDFQGRTAVGAGQGPGLPPVQIGEMSGAEATTLSTNQMPAHAHGARAVVAVSSGNATTGDIGNNIYANTSGNTYAATNLADGALAGVSGNDGPVGNNLPFGLRQPYLGMNFVICLDGAFPSRN